MNDGLYGFPAPRVEDDPQLPPSWRHCLLFTNKVPLTNNLRTPPNVYHLGVACWGRGGRAENVQGHGGGGAGFCFIVLDTRPGELLPEMIFEKNGDTRFGSLMIARAGKDANPNRPGVGGQAQLFIDNAYGMIASGGRGGKGGFKKLPGSNNHLVAGGGGGAAGSFYGEGGNGGNVVDSIFMNENTICATSASGGGFGGDGVDSGPGGAAPGGSGVYHSALSRTLSQGGKPPKIWKRDSGIPMWGLGGGGGGGTCSAGGQGRLKSSHETLSSGAQGGSGINGRGGMGAKSTCPAHDGISYPGEDKHGFLALANLRLSGGGGGGGNEDFKNGGHGGPGAGGGGACASDPENQAGGGRGGTGGIGGGGGGAAMGINKIELMSFRGGGSLFGGGGGGSVSAIESKPGVCMLGGGGQGGFLGKPVEASPGCIILYW
ncbi:MAG: hypothetical protein ABW115_14445 [Candidatus Thiodiazotropha sp. 6PLUC6]